MSDESAFLASRSQPTDLITVKIKLNGSDMNGEYSVTSLHIDKGFNKISSARVIISDGDPSKQDFTISSKEDALVPGSQIEINVGYHAQGKTVFKGLIIKHAIKSGKNKKSSLTIEAKDKAIRLTNRRKNHCYLEQTDKDIIESIVQKAEISFEASGLSLKHKQMIQNNCYDWDFIVTRAEMNGMVVLTDNNKLIVKKPDTNQQPVKEITFGVDVVEFESEIDATAQLKEVKTQSWNYKDQKIENFADVTVPFKEAGNIESNKLAEVVNIDEAKFVHAGSIDTEELKLWGESRLLKSKLAKAIGRIKVKGTTEVEIGQVIKLSGFSKRFNGSVIVSGIKHHYEESAWETDIHFGLKEQWFYQREDVIEKPASGLVPGINGLQTAIVTQLENDPENEGRVKILLPLIDANEAIWARIASLDAGKERGSFFRPEIQDEVVVGFLNDDPRYPIILGMLNSSAKPGAMQATDTNHEKGFVTRSKMKLIFNDEKKTLTIETPKGKKVEINDDSDSITFSDQHSNKIKMDAEGISIESLKNISLKASSGDVQIEGINIQNKAKVKFSAEANATASLQASGSTTVKGGIVNIN